MDCSLYVFVNQWFRLQTWTNHTPLFCTLICFLLKTKHCFLFCLCLGGDLWTNCITLRLQRCYCGGGCQCHLVVSPVLGYLMVALSVLALYCTVVYVCMNVCCVKLTVFHVVGVCAWFNLFSDYYASLNVPLWLSQYMCYFVDLTFLVYIDCVKWECVFNVCTQ